MSEAVGSSVAGLPARPAAGLRRPALWKFYEVEVRGFPPYTLTAASRGKALYDSYLSYSECRDCSFAEFLKIARVRRARAPANDGYGYVRRAYGVDPVVGQRAKLRNEGPEWNGREVTVIYPNKSSTAYVHFVDDAGRSLIVHPMNIELLPLSSEVERSSRGEAAASALSTDESNTSPQKDITHDD